MLRIALLVISTVGAALVVSNVSQTESPEPVAIVETVQEDGVTSLGKALRFVGVCSVLCSLIWGGAIITVAKKRRTP